MRSFLRALTVAGTPQELPLKQCEIRRERPMNEAGAGVHCAPGTRRGGSARCLTNSMRGGASLLAANRRREFALTDLDLAETARVATWPARRVPRNGLRLR